MKKMKKNYYCEDLCSKFFIWFINELILLIEKFVIEESGEKNK